jgi:hypothetical protein
LLLKAIKIVFKTKKCISNVGFLIGGDEAYLFGSIYGQTAELSGIPNIYFKDFGKLSGFKFNSDMLYSGISNYQKYYKQNQLEILSKENELSEIVKNKINFHYMKNRNFKHEISNLFNPNDKYIILYLHDFIDSPGVFGHSVFLDIPSWVKFCAKQTLHSGYKLIVKTHPNALDLNFDMVEKLKKEVLNKYSHAMLIHDDFSLFELSKNIEIHCVLTVFGSVIYEAAFLGIKVISCGNAPANFFIEVSENAKNKIELKFLLKEITKPNNSEIQMLRSKSVEAFSVYSYFVNQSEIASIPYDFISNKIKEKIFNSEFDPVITEITPEIWKNSIRLENFIKKELDRDKYWLTKLKSISNNRFIANVQ